MKNKFKIKFNFIIILTIFMLLFAPMLTYASDVSDGGTSSSKKLQDLNSYIGSPTVSDELLSRVGIIFGVIQTIGSVVSVVMLIVIGIKYMTGSIEEKAEYKKTLWPYVLGAFLIFTGSYVPQFIYTIAQSFE